MSEAIYVLTQFRRDRLPNLQRTISLVREVLRVPCMLVASPNYGPADTFSGMEILRFAGSRKLPIQSTFLPPLPWDIGEKRFGIHQHARSQGFNAISMIDDDIVVSSEDLRNHSLLIECHDIVSSIVEHFPDNSIFFHARRVLRGERHANPSGSLLTVRTNETLNAFFNIYNEDWFFFFLNPTARHASRASVRQLRYDPFRNPHLAAWQEPYDLIAEGLRASGASAFTELAASEEFWTEEISRRRAGYETMLGLSRDAAVAACLRAGLRELSKVSPSFCTTFCVTLGQTVKQDYRIAV